MSNGVLTVLKYCFLALMYVFLLRVVFVVVRELRAPALTADAAAVPATSPAKRQRSGGPRLRLLDSDGHHGETYAVSDEVTVGRGGGCGIVIAQDHYASTVHARLFRRNGDVYVEDLGSRNGTFVNGEQISSARRLRRGDRLQFGRTNAEVVR